MTSQEISNMIFNIKDKITDKEFKDIMEKLSIKHEEDKKEDTYELRYIKRETLLSTTTPERDVAWRMKETIKIKKVKIDDDYLNLDAVIDEIIENQDGFFNDINIGGGDFVITKKNNIRYLGKVPIANTDWLENFDAKENYEDGDCGIWLIYKKLIPIHIKKSTCHK